MITEATVIKEQNFFLNSPDSEDTLYCSLYMPEADTGNVGVVIVPPLGQERHWIFREMVNLARDLAQAGFPVIRFDYRGEGESSGEFSDSTISSRMHDIKYAVEELKKRAVVKEVCMLGYRLGATLSLLSAKELSCKYVIACDPITDAKQYADGLIKSNVAMQLYYFGKVTKSEKALKDSLLSGATVSAYGFQLSNKLVNELEQLDITSLLSNQRYQSLIIYFSMNAASPKNDLLRMHELLNTSGLSQLLCVKEDFSPTAKRNWRPKLFSLNQAVTDWLNNVS